MDDKIQRCQEYVEALEEERHKIQVFHRELPLCLELVTQAIDACRQQLATTVVEYFPGPFECSEQTSNESPILKDFIPNKQCSSSEEKESHKPKKMRNDKAGKKRDWLKSAQLWSQDPHSLVKQDHDSKTSVIEIKKSGGAFHSFQADKGITKTSTATSPSSIQTVTASSTTAETANGGDRRGEKEGQSHRKPRRCWSPELHRCFLHALQQLGASDVATPKQIRELMKVDGLSNDEVKSHLQKYRLHTRRPSVGIHNNGNPQQPQFVVVGRIWLPLTEYATVAETAGKTNGVAANEIYAPVAVRLPAVPVETMLGSQLQQQQQNQSQPSPLHSEERRSLLGDDNTHSNSPATSSPTNSTPVSPTL